MENERCPSSFLGCRDLFSTISRVASKLGEKELREELECERAS